MEKLHIFRSRQRDVLIAARAATKLRDGHIRITLFSEDEADWRKVAKDEEPEWLKRFDTKLKVRVRSFPVVVHGVDLREITTPPPNIDPKAPSSTEFASLSALSKPLSGLDLDSIRRTKTHTSFVISCPSAHQANSLITQRVSHAGRLLRTERFHARLLQCFNCQRFGHLARQCKRPPVCGHCAAEHLTRKCVRASDHACPDSSQCHHPPALCALCKGSHSASSRACPVRQELIQKRAMAFAMAGPFYPEELPSRH